MSRYKKGEAMSRYIDAVEFFKKAQEIAYPVVHGLNNYEKGLTLMGLAQLLDEQPTADVRENVRGEWIDDNCSVCGQYVYHGDARYFCPRCGADMRGEEE